MQELTPPPSPAPEPPLAFASVEQVQMVIAHSLPALEAALRLLSA